jgi:hypothetical protein
MKKYIGLMVLALALIAGRANAQICSGSNCSGGGSAPGATSNVGGLINNGGSTQVGSTVIAGIGQPAAPTFGSGSTPGSTNATYYCDALDINGLTNTGGGAGNTIASAGATFAGAATPNTTVVCGGQTGALGYVVTKGATGGTVELGHCLTMGSGNTCSVVDTGQALTSYTANTSDKTPTITTSQMGIGGENIGNAGDATIWHDLYFYNGGGSGNITGNGDNDIVANGGKLIVTSGTASITPIAFASCAGVTNAATGTCSQAGNICSITDDATACAFSATITNGGAHSVIGYCDGTQYVMLECK